VKHFAKNIMASLSSFPSCLRFLKALFLYLFLKLYFKRAQIPLFKRGLKDILRGNALILRGNALYFERKCATLGGNALILRGNAPNVN